MTKYKQQQAMVGGGGRGSVSRFVTIYYPKCPVFNKKL